MRGPASQIQEEDDSAGRPRARRLEYTAMAAGLLIMALLLMRFANGSLHGPFSSV
jgi:succinate dehydrogenase flavin-adding protein (antitoxin of CptAB toxin-antitoxin module)